MSHSLNNSSKYRAFVSKKNRTLEFLLDFYLGKIDDHLDMLVNLVEKAASHYTWEKNQDYHQQVRNFSQSIDRPFDLTAALIANHFMVLKKATYGLSFVAENEALKNLLGTAGASPDGHRMDSPDTFAGGDARARVFHAFAKLKAKLNDAFSQSLLLHDNSEETLARVRAVMPKKYPRADVRRVIRKPQPIKEAARKNPLLGFISDDAWNSLVDEYLVTLPSRGPTDVVKVPTVVGSRERYQWEVEQEITNEFVKDVRQGQHDAAKKNGITDFVWVTVLDQKTDECCLWRDGKTSKEIQSEMARHKDDCKAIVPPAHFNCRCDMAPVTDKLPDTEELGDFETWLTPK